MKIEREKRRLQRRIGQQVQDTGLLLKTVSDATIPDVLDTLHQHLSELVNDLDWLISFKPAMAPPTTRGTTRRSRRQRLIKQADVLPETTDQAGTDAPPAKYTLEPQPITADARKILDESVQDTPEEPEPVAVDNEEVERGQDEIIPEDETIREESLVPEPQLLSLAPSSHVVAVAASDNTFPLSDTAREQLILESLPQIKYIAHRVAAKLPAHIELNDLVGAGVLGLLDAVEKFDPSLGVKFKSYAELRIKGAIFDSLRKLDWAPRSLRKKSKDLEKAYGDLEQRLGRPATDKEVSDKMGITLDEFNDLILLVKGLSLGSFQEMASQEDDRTSEPLIKYVPEAPQMDPFFIFQKAEIRSILANAIDALPKKERMVVSLYYYDELTMKEIGMVYNVNESRISQLHTRAMLRLRIKLFRVAAKHDPGVKQPLRGNKPSLAPIPDIPEVIWPPTVTETVQ